MVRTGAAGRRWRHARQVAEPAYETLRPVGGALQIAAQARLGGGAPAAAVGLRQARGAIGAITDWGSRASGRPR